MEATSFVNARAGSEIMSGHHFEIMSLMMMRGSMHRMSSWYGRSDTLDRRPRARPAKDGRRASRARRPPAGRAGSQLELSSFRVFQFLSFFGFSVAPAEFSFFSVINYASFVFCFFSITCWRITVVHFFILAFSVLLAFILNLFCRRFASV